MKEFQIDSDSDETESDSFLSVSWSDQESLEADPIIPRSSFLDQILHYQEKLHEHCGKTFDEQACCRVLRKTFSTSRSRSDESNASISPEDVLSDAPLTVEDVLENLGVYKVASPTLPPRFLASIRDRWSHNTKMEETDIRILNTLVTFKDSLTKRAVWGETRMTSVVESCTRASLTAKRLLKNKRFPVVRSSKVP